MLSSGFIRRHSRTFAALAFLFAYSVGISFATPPVSPYQPGTTLQPSCLPGSTNCTTQILPSQTGNTGKLLTTDGSTTTWSLVPNTSLQNSTITINGSAIALGGSVSNLALVTNPLSQFAATTSAQLASVISDETGTGTLVYATSPTLSTVGINTAPTASPLTVGGDIRIATGSGGQIVFADGSTMSSAGLGSAAALSNITDAIVTADSDANTSGAILLKTGSTTRFSISNTGTIAIPSFTTGLIHTDVSGNLSSSLIVNGDITTGTIAANKLVGTDIATVGTVTSGIWNAGAVTSSGAITGTSFIKSGGTSSQFLKADGSVDATAYLPLAGGTLSGGLSGTTGSFSGLLNANSLQLAAWNTATWSGSVVSLGGVTASQWQQADIYTNGVQRLSVTNTQVSTTVPFSAGANSVSGGIANFGGTINANYTGGNIRLYNDGTNAADGGIFVTGGAGGQIYYSNWNGNRGIQVDLSSSRVTVLGGGALWAGAGNFTGDFDISTNTNALRRLAIGNNSTGTAGDAAMIIQNSTNTLWMGLPSTGYTTSGLKVANTGYLYSDSAGGINMGASHASGDVRLYSRGALALTLGASQAATFTGAVTGGVANFTTGNFSGAVNMVGGALIATSSNSPYANSAVLYSGSAMGTFIGVDGGFSTKYFGMKSDGSFSVAGGGTATFSSTIVSNSTGLVGSAINGNTGALYDHYQNTGGDLYFGLLSSTGTFWNGGAGPAYASTFGTNQSTALTFATNSIIRQTIDINGNVGIGQINPSYKLEVVSGSTIGIRLQTANSTYGSPQIDIYDSTRAVETVVSSTDGTSNGTYVASYSNHPLMFGTYAGSTPTAKMTILQGGNVGIGTTGPSAKLEVVLPSGSNGQIVRIGRSAGAYFYGFGVDSSSTFNIYDNDSTTSRFSITSSGNVGIASLPSYASGTLCNSGGYIGVCSSDSRLKENIRYFDSSINGIAIINSLKPAIFDVINGDKNVPGFIAQDIQQVLPNAVVVNKVDGLLNFTRDEIVPYLVKAVQEMDIKVQDISSLDINNPHSLGSLVKQFLADAGNTVQDIFANKVHTKELCISDEGGETCVTRSQLNALLGSQSSGGSGSPAPQATCSDGIQNQDETGIDTGGVCGGAGSPQDTPPPGDVPPPEEQPATP